MSDSRTPFQEMMDKAAAKVGLYPVVPKGKHAAPPKFRQAPSRGMVVSKIRQRPKR